MRYLAIVAVIVAIVLFSAVPILGGSAGLLELRAGKTTYQGKVVARAKGVCWLLDRGGQLHSVELKSVDSFRRVSPQFRGHSPAIVRSQLLKEFGTSYEVVGTRHYLVCAARGQANKYAELFEDVYRTFYRHFAIRGFTISEPEFPLVAVVLPDHSTFSKYCQQDNISASRGLMGYYLQTSNRVALFDPAGASLTAATRSNTRPAERAWASRSVQGDLQDTVIHEATHQVAFNTGLHSRLGENPKWIVEGLATVFESPGIRDRSSNRSVENRINPMRLQRFCEYSAQRRKPKSLAAFVSGDEMFQTATLDAYCEAWALTFYLVETRPRKYARLLKTVAARGPLARYQPDERLDDFKNAFGTDLGLLEANFLRYLKKLR